MKVRRSLLDANGGAIHAAAGGDEDITGGVVGAVSLGDDLVAFNELDGCIFAGLQGQLLLASF